MSMIDTVPALMDSAATLTASELNEDIVFPEDTMIGQLRNWADELPDTLQWLGLVAIGAIPFLESYGAGLIGVFIDMPVVLAILFGALGNFICVAILIYTAAGARSAVQSRRQGKELSPRQIKRREKAKRNFDRFGVPGVALLGPLALPSQFTAPLMVSFGASRTAVLIWMAVSILAWGGFGAGFGVLILNMIA